MFEESATALPRQISRVSVTIGRKPRFWNRNVAFVANLLGLFFDNEEQTQLLVDTVGEVDSYGGRLLPVLDLLYAGKGKNLLMLEREPDQDLAEYFQETAGLSLPEVVVLPHSEYLGLESRIVRGEELDSPACRRLVEHPAPALDGYVTDVTLARLADYLRRSTFSTVEGSRRGNNKSLLHRFLQQSDMPMPPTEFVGSRQDLKAALSRIWQAGYSSAVVKAALGASGIGLIKVSSPTDFDPAGVPEHFFCDGPVLVQAWLKPGEFGVETIRSPSVQLFLGDDGVTLWDVTEQILGDDSVHEGNEAPPPYLDISFGLQEELLRQAGLVAQWLHEQGYRGTGSVDFLVAFGSKGAFTVYVCEINARVTGATYPAVLARHFLPEGAWLLRNLRFTEPVAGREILDLLRTSGDLYIPEKSEFGVIPVNFNFGSDGLVRKGQFLCLSSSPKSNKLLMRMAELDLPCSFDRD